MHTFGERNAVFLLVRRPKANGLWSFREFNFQPSIIGGIVAHTPEIKIAGTSDHWDHDSTIIL